MKKQSIALVTLLIVSSGLYGLTPNDVLQQFNISFGTLFGQGYLFDTSIAATQNQNLAQWSNAMSAAKTFVMDNSKNLVGLKDSDLINAITDIEKNSIDLVNSIKVTRAISTATDITRERNRLIFIRGHMKTIADTIKSKSYTINDKKEAQRVIIAVATFVESAADKTLKDIEKKKTMLKITD